MTLIFNHHLNNLKQRALNLPHKPGVYLMKNKDGQVIYVGKAKDLPKRVISYFQYSNLSPRISLMVKQIHDFDFFVTSTEKEALILENSLIKQHHPKFNVILRDDKTYPSLRLDFKEDFPRLEVVRKVKKDGSIIFGPFPSSHALRETLWLIGSLFPLRKCRRKEVKNIDRPCLNFQLNKCLGPCRAEVSSDEYKKICQQVVLFFQGRHKDLIKNLLLEMEMASDNLEFEKAAKIRDRIASVNKTLEKQDISLLTDKDQDVFALVNSETQFLAVILHLRSGHVLGNEPLNVKFSEDLEKSEILENLISQYYAQDHYIPDEIIISEELDSDSNEFLSDWLSDLKEKQVKIINPQRGAKVKLVKLAEKNALELLKERQRKAENIKDSMLELQEKLALEFPPKRLECFDLSHWQGDSAVAGLVVMENGVWLKSHYRRFKIKTARGGDDYAGMREAVARRYKHSEWPQPDLLLIDGGKGQLSAALLAFESLSLPAPPIVAIAEAKSHHELDSIFIPGRKNPLDFKYNSPALLVLMRLRDEAHRYAGNYHRTLSSKILTQSAVVMVKGLGPKRRQKLLDAFGTWEMIASLTEEDILTKVSIPRKIIKELKKQLEMQK